MSSMDKLKDFTYGTLVPFGYSMEFKSPSVAELDTLIELASACKVELLKQENKASQEFSDKEMLLIFLGRLTRLINDDCLNWSDKYDKCWEIKTQINVYLSVDWGDPFTCLTKDVVMAFYNAAKEQIEEYCNG